METRTYAFPFAPITQWDGYKSVRNSKKRFMPEHIQIYKKAIRVLMETHDKKLGKGKLVGPFFKTDMVFVFCHADFFFKNGKIRKRDATNFIKFFEDAMFEYLEVDDNHNISTTVTKLWVPNDVLTAEDIQDYLPEGKRDYLWKKKWFPKYCAHSLVKLTEIPSDHTEMPVGAYREYLDTGGERVHRLTLK